MDRSYYGRLWGRFYTKENVRPDIFESYGFKKAAEIVAKKLSTINS